MKATEIRVLITRAETGLIQKLLAAATELGIPIAEIRSNPLGFIVPPAVAAKVGLLNDVCEQAPVEKVAPTRKRSPRKQESAADVGQMVIDEIWSE